MAPTISSEVFSICQRKQFTTLKIGSILVGPSADSTPKAGQRKHPEVDYFIYYKTKISGKDYYVNAKMHKEQKREVLYTINSRKPDTIVIGEPRDLEKYKK